MKRKNFCIEPRNFTCFITLRICAWIRATSSRPIWWICSGVRSVVVLWRALNAYQWAPSGKAPRPALSRVAGR